MTSPNGTSGNEPVSAPGIHDEDWNATLAAPRTQTQMRATGQAMVDIILAQVLYALSGINVLGVHFLDPFGILRSFADGLVAQANAAYAQANAASAAAADAADAAAGAQNTADGAQVATGVLGTQVGSIQNQINTPDSKAIDVSLRDGEVGFDWGRSNADLTVTPSVARGLLVRIKHAEEKRVLGFMGYRDAGTTEVYCDGGIYFPEDGTFERHYQSPNIFSEVEIGSSPATGYRMVQFTIPADQALVADNGELWAWMLSTVGGNLYVRGWNDTNPASSLRPYRAGFISLAGRLPATVDQVTADSAFVADAPYIEFDRYRAPQPLHRYDPFTRTAVGPDWVAPQTTQVAWGFDPQYPDILNGRMGFRHTTTSYFGDFMGHWYRYRATLVDGGMRVTAQIRNPSSAPTYLLIGGRDWSSYAAVGIRNTAADIWTHTTSSWNAMTQRATQLETIIDGDFVSFEWLAGDNVYNVYLHADRDNPYADPPLVSWPDATGILSHGGAFQYFGAIYTAAGYVNSAELEDFKVDDISAALPIPGGGGGVGLPHPLPHPIP
jgi:hypothetical protein